MVTGKTSSGFEFSLDEEVLDDYEILEQLCEIDKGNSAMAPEVIEEMLGKEQLWDLKQHIRNEKGRVSAKKMMKEFAEILAANKTTKNS